MKQYIFCLFIITYACAQKSSCDNSLLWKISGNNLKQPSYLLGTFHDEGYKSLDKTPYLYKSLSDVCQLIGEINMTQMDSEIFRSITMPKDTCYSDLLNKEDIQFLDSILLKYLRKTSDIHLQKWAFNKGYTIMGLDDIHLIHNNMGKITPLNIEAKNMITSLRNNIMINQLQLSSLDSLRNAYLRQDLIEVEKFMKLYHKDIGMDSSVYNHIFKLRNLQWMEHIPYLIEEKPSLIAVGVGHLIGDCGLIKLLREKGYKVQPVTE
jgi:uncharacterized protein YbaP (TraB family)